MTGFKELEPEVSADVFTAWRAQGNAEGEKERREFQHHLEFLAGDWIKRACDVDLQRLEAHTNSTTAALLAQETLAMERSMLHLQGAAELPPDPQATLATTQATAPKSKDTAGAQPEFPTKFASWLHDRLRERGLSIYDLAKHSGPDPETIKKIYRGETVRNDVLARLSRALSSFELSSGRRVPVDVLDIPKD